jgi:hypothetical protein
MDLHKVGLKAHMIAARTTDALRTDQHGVSRNHQDRQERCQQPGCETQEDGSEQGT